MTKTEPVAQLSPHLDCVAASPEPWFLVQSEGGREKSVARHLCEVGISYYLPIRRIARRHGGQRRIVEVPMFDGYLFGSGTDLIRAGLLDRKEHRYVLDTIAPPRAAQLRDELTSLEIALFADPSFGDRCEIPVGSYAEVVAGKFEGCRVIVEKNTGRTVLAMSCLNAGILLEIDPAHLAPIEISSFPSLPVPHGRRRF